MNQNDKTVLFETKPIPNAVASLTIPTVLSSLVTVLYNLADTYFVGMLNNPVENAAVTLAAPLILAFYAVTNLFGVGTSSVMGRALGRKDYTTTRKSAAFGFWSAALLSVIFSLIFIVFKSKILKTLGASAENIEPTSNYLFWTVAMGAAPSILNVVLSYLVRTEGAAMHAGIGTMSGCIINIILDPFFVLPRFLNMGASGAGLATFISNCAACIYYFILLFIKRKNTYISLKPKDAVPQKDIAAGIFAVGIPASIQNLLNVTSMTLLNNFTAAFNSNAVAAMGISFKTAMIPMQISMGLTQGIMPLVSYNFGSGDIKRAGKSVWFTGKIAVAFLVFVSILFYIFSGNIVNFFIDNNDIISYGSRFLRGMCLSLPFHCIDFLGVMVYQSCGKGYLSLVFAFARKVVLEIPALIILNKLFPLYGLAYAQFITEAVLSAAAIFTMIKLFTENDKSIKISG